MVKRTRSWGGRRAGQTGRPPKWPPGTVRRSMHLPPDVAEALGLLAADLAGVDPEERGPRSADELLIGLARIGYLQVRQIPTTLARGAALDQPPVATD